ncbi:hypothetical protein OAO87_01080 [bacterium]|nr:hypothetical protein [bacterium]
MERLIIEGNNIGASAPCLSVTAREVHHTTISCSSHPTRATITHGSSHAGEWEERAKRSSVDALYDQAERLRMQAFKCYRVGTLPALKEAFVAMLRFTKFHSLVTAHQGAVEGSVPFKKLRRDVVSVITALEELKPRLAKLIGEPEFSAGVAVDALEHRWAVSTHPTAPDPPPPPLPRNEPHSPYEYTNTMEARPARAVGGDVAASSLHKPLASVVAGLRDGEDSQAQAVSRLADLIDQAEGAAAEAVGKAIRESGTMATLLRLVDRPQTQQDALRVIGNLASSAVDAHAEETKSLLHELGALPRVLPLIHASSPATVVYALGAVQNMCTRPEQAEHMSEVGSSRARARVRAPALSPALCACEAARSAGSLQQPAAISCSS